MTPNKPLEKKALPASDNGRAEASPPGPDIPAKPERNGTFQTFVSLLQEQIPSTFLGPLSAKEKDWLFREFFQLFEERKSDVAVRLIPFGGRDLLLTHAADAPFLLDSIQNFLKKEEARFQVVSHPILAVRRRQGLLTELGGLERKGPRESFIVMELIGGAAALPALKEGVSRVIEAALQVYRDQQAIAERLREIAELPATEPFRDFLQWLRQENFLPFSYHCLVVRKEGPEIRVKEVENSPLGLAHEPPGLDSSRFRPLEDFDPSFRGRLLRRRPVVVERIERRSPLHRDEKLVYLGIREGDEDREWREHVFLGLFSQKSFDEPASNIPPLRQKLLKALSALHIPREAHDHRKTLEIFNSFPKIELFFIDQDELAQTIRSFNQLYRREGVKVVATRSLSVAGLTLLVIMPRDFYEAEILARIETYLSRFFRAPGVAIRVIHISADYLSCHAEITGFDDLTSVHLERLEIGLTHIARPWKMRLRLRFSRIFGERDGGALWNRYRNAFTREYQTLTHPRFAVRDVRRIEEVLATGREAFDLWGPFLPGAAYYRLQFYSLRKSYLNELMPFLENLNLRVLEEVDFVLQVDGRDVFIKSFSLRTESAESLSLTAVRGVFLDAVGALRRGEAENDYLNRLLVLTGLSGREIDVFRGYRNYLFQLGTPFSKKRVAFALINNPTAALLLFRYFEARFSPEPAWQNPTDREEKALSPIRQELLTALGTVSDLNEDRILRTLFNLIDSTIRTNFFLRRDRPDYFFSFKISAIGIIDMPAPRPLFEIYVHATTMEGIHLRGGKVARGGIRWSDRPDDFRTEILGLMKTQMAKNALIVPVGSKGGFIVKTPFANREEGMALASDAYRMLIRGMLDLTDNRIGDQVVSPAGVVRYDGDDPYLVVAADKGTAHLPDTANAVSREYGFWLGDAFASGGSRGYDHKKLGITARGAWECVKRHFREMGKNIDTEPFTVVGIGDMSGDVFGNGMLLSRQIRLLAAFDHRHIFLDPDPDPEISFQERQRLFGLPRSSWDDYRKELISSGGGVYSRTAKDIPLSPEVRQWLGVRHSSIDSEGLIRLLLTAEADLLWNGGIGTYIKASFEKDEDVGDRINDSVRVDAVQVRARVIGEGGNLGLTQKGRIEYALGGGRINTDAVDNSAGVDCSDHEVNLKILMRQLVDKKILASGDERDAMLLQLTGDVCQAVLDNNYGQSLCVSLDQRRSALEVEPFLDLADRLSEAGILDLRGESLPSLKEVLARKDRTLTRPELAVLMAYSKMQLTQVLMDSELPSRAGVRNYLRDYFPPLVRERFGKYLDGHPLAREITATMITNAVVNQAGSAFLNPISRQRGASLVDVASAYLTFDQVLRGTELRRQIYLLDNRMTAARQYEILLMLEESLAVLCRWALRYEMETVPEEPVILRLREEMSSYLKILGGILQEPQWRQIPENAAALQKEGLPEAVSRQIATLPFLDDFLPVVSLAARTGGDLFSVARTLNDVRDFLDMKGILKQMQGVQIRDRWDRMALQMLKAGFIAVIHDLTLAVWQERDGNLEAFFGARRQKVAFFRSLRENLRGATPANYHPLTVLVRALEDLIPRK